MNNKEFTAELSRRLGCTLEESAEQISLFTAEMTQRWQDGDVVSIQGFGSFEVKKKTERISVNPSTKQRLLIPPKLILSYKPSCVLKDKFK